jgi:hypothetical protein
MNRVELSEKAKKIKLGHYQNWQNKNYKVLGVAVHTENLEEMVVYQALYGDKIIWVRPIDMFLGEKTLESGEKVSRFRFIK